MSNKTRAIVYSFLFATVLGSLIFKFVTAPYVEIRIAALGLFILWIIVGMYALWIFVPQFDPWLKEARRTLKGEKIAALTFDDGPSEPWTSRVLDILKAKGVRATFFVVGNRARRFPELVRRASQEGHIIGAHTATHRILTFLAEADRFEEIEESMDAVSSIIGYRPNLFRLPHGFKFPGIYRVMQEWKVIPIPWTKGVWDTEMPSEKKLFSRFSKKFKPFEILLLHDGISGNDPAANRESMVSALPKMIDEYRRRGYKFMTIAEICDQCGCFKK